MSKKSQSKIVDFLMGNGFYLVLALCILGAGGAAFIAANRTITTQPPAVTSSQEGAATSSASEKPTPIVNPSPQPMLPTVDDEDDDVQTDTPSDDAPEDTDVNVTPDTNTTQNTTPNTTATIPIEQDAQEALAPKVTYQMPVTGEIIASFSGETLVKNETLGHWQTHNGTDIRAVKGSAISAIAPGTVEAVRVDPLWGGIVEISHSGDITSYYCGLDRDIPVRKGDTVEAGDTIGKLDYIPAESLMAEHLHLEVKKNGEFIDFEELLLTK